MVLLRHVSEQDVREAVVTTCDRLVCLDVLYLSSLLFLPFFFFFPLGSSLFCRLNGWQNLEEEYDALCRELIRGPQGEVIMWNAKVHEEAVQRQAKGTMRFADSLCEVRLTLW